MAVAGKTNKSVNLTNEMIEKLTNYNKRTGTTFSEIVEKSLNMYFEALEKGNEIGVETLGDEDMDNSILVPIALYIKINNLVAVQLKNLEKQGKVQIRTFTESNKSKSKSKFVVLTEKNPEFYKAKMAMFELSMKNYEDRLGKIEEKVRLQNS